MFTTIHLATHLRTDVEYKWWRKEDEMRLGSTITKQRGLPPMIPTVGGPLYVCCRVYFQYCFGIGKPHFALAPPSPSFSLDFNAFWEKPRNKRAILYGVGNFIVSLPLKKIYCGAEIARTPSICSQTSCCWWHPSDELGRSRATIKKSFFFSPHFLW